MQGETALPYKVRGLIYIKVYADRFIDIIKDEIRALDTN